MLHHFHAHIPQRHQLVGFLAGNFITVLIRPNDLVRIRPVKSRTPVLGIQSRKFIGIKRVHGTSSHLYPTVQIIPVPDFILQNLVFRFYFIHQLIEDGTKIRVYSPHETAFLSSRSKVLDRRKIKIKLKPLII